MWTPGEAEAIHARAQATAEGIRMVSESFKTEGSTEVSHVFFLDPSVRILLLPNKTYMAACILLVHETASLQPKWMSRPPTS